MSQGIRNKELDKKEPQVVDLTNVLKNSEKFHIKEKIKKIILLHGRICPPSTHPQRQSFFHFTKTLTNTIDDLDSDNSEKQKIIVKLGNNEEISHDTLLKYLSEMNEKSSKNSRNSNIWFGIVIISFAAEVAGWVIFNGGTDTAETLATAITLDTVGGLLVITGLLFIYQIEKKQSEIDEANEAYYGKYEWQKCDSVNAYLTQETDDENDTHANTVTNPHFSFS